MKTTLLLIASCSILNAADYSLRIDNDILAGTDTDYTSGVEFRVTEDTWSFGMTHHIYTPTDEWSVTPLHGERPYASFMELDYSLRYRAGDSVTSVGLALGVTGEWAGGESIQGAAHRQFNGKNFQGWDSQLPNEVTLGLVIDHTTHHELSEYVDLITSVGGMVGTRRTALDSSVTLKMGKLDGTRAYVFSGVGGSLVLHDITLDGSLTQEWSHSVHSELFVGEFTFGLGVGLGDFELILSRTIRTKEFTTQRNNHTFDSIQLMWVKEF